MILVACTTSNDAVSNDFGNCTFEPGAQCPNQDLVAVTAAESDLRGADLSGSNFEGADLRNSDLRDANLSDTVLVGVDLTGADLRGADLSRAKVFEATFDSADWVGSTRTGTRYCHTILPDGGVSDCPELDGVVVPFDETPPEVVRLAAARPEGCKDDFVGEGIEVDWEVLRADYVVFLVDDVQVAASSGKRGVKRLPFTCDGKPHRVTIQAFGIVSEIGTSTITVAVDPRR